MLFVQVRCENESCNAFIRYQEVKDGNRHPKEECPLCQVRSGKRDAFGHLTGRSSSSLPGWIETEADFDF